MNNQKAVAMVASCLLNACLSTVKANPDEGVNAVLVGVVYATFLHGEFGRLEAVPIPTLASQMGIVTHISLPNNLGLVISASRLLEMEDMFTEMLVRANKDTEQKEN